MTEFKQGDEYALPVALAEECAGPGVWRAEYTSHNGSKASIHVHAPSLELIRRAPVDLATCDLSEPVAVSDVHDGSPGLLIARDGLIGWVRGEHNHRYAALLSDLRPLGAPAPAPDQSDESKMLYHLLDTIGAKHLTEAETQVLHMAAEIERLKDFAQWAAKQAVRMDCTAQTLLNGLKIMADRALASTAPACADEGGFAWLWFGQDDKDDQHLSFGRRARHPSQRRYKLAETQAAEHGTPTCPPGHIMIGDRAVPDPMREAPEGGATYWFVSLGEIDGVESYHWRGDEIDNRLLSRGLIHSTKSAARTHAEAIISLSAKREG